MVFLHSTKVLYEVTLDEDDLTLATSKVVANVDLCSNLIQQVIQRTIFLPLTLHSRYIDLGAKTQQMMNFWFSDSFGNICIISRTLERSSWEKAPDNVSVSWLPLGLPLHDRQRLFLPRALR